jgi:hypothetical protein
MKLVEGKLNKTIKFNYQVIQFWKLNLKNIN